MAFKLFGLLKKDAPINQEQSGESRAQGNPQMQPQRDSNRPMPEDRVAFLISQGLAEPEIIKVLKDEGYSFQEIDSGITNVLKRQVSSEQPSSDYSYSGAQNEDLAPVFNPTPAEVSREEAEQQKKAALVEEMNEVIETLIEEKFSSVIDELEKVDKRFAEVNERLRQLNSRISEFESHEKGVETSDSERIGELKAKEESIEPRISSLEKAFKDIIPNLVDSIRELREIAVSSKHREASAREFTETNAAETGSVSEEEKSAKESIFD